MADGALLLGADVGTTTAKAGVFDVDGRLLAFADSAYGIERPQADWAEQDARTWWQAFVDIVEALARDVDVSRIRAVGICSQVNTHVFVGANGADLAPAILWQDQRAATEAEALTARLAGAGADSELTIDGSALVARAAWMQRHRPDVWEATRWILSPKDYLNLRLTGRPATDVISPIGVVGADFRYDGRILDLVPGLRERVPPLRHFTDALARVKPNETRLPAEAVAVVATMDAWANLYGSGVVQPGQAMEVAGTSEILGVLSERAQPTDGVVTFPPLDGAYLHAGPTQAGGDALRWFADAHRVELETVLASAAAAPPGSLGLVFLPYLAGERAPLWDAEARGVFFGLSSDHSIAHEARAVLEGVAFAARHLLETLEEAGDVRVDALASSGGGARSDLWCQIKADVLGREIRRLRVLQSGVLGAGLMAAAGTGVVRDLRHAAATAVEVADVFRPAPERVALYDRLYAVYRGLYPALQPAYRELSRFRLALEPTLRQKGSANGR
jgi:xylulokinase